MGSRFEADIIHRDFSPASAFAERILRSSDTARGESLSEMGIRGPKSSQGGLGFQPRGLAMARRDRNDRRVVAVLVLKHRNNKQALETSASTTQSFICEIRTTGG